MQHSNPQFENVTPQNMAEAPVPKSHVHKDTNQFVQQDTELRHYESHQQPHTLNNTEIYGVNTEHKAYTNTNTGDRASSSFTLSQENSNGHFVSDPTHTSESCLINTFSNENDTSTSTSLSDTANLISSAIVVNNETQYLNKILTSVLSQDNSVPTDKHQKTNNPSNLSNDTQFVNTSLNSVHKNGSTHTEK
jgi:hypothetical protein